jgi:hypothetical protein
MTRGRLRLIGRGALRRPPFLRQEPPRSLRALMAAEAADLARLFLPLLVAMLRLTIGVVAMLPVRDRRTRSRGRRDPVCARQANGPPAPTVRTCYPSTRFRSSPEHRSLQGSRSRSPTTETLPRRWKAVVEQRKTYPGGRRGVVEQRKTYPGGRFGVVEQRKTYPGGRFGVVEQRKTYPPGSSGVVQQPKLTLEIRRPLFNNGKPTRRVRPPLFENPRPTRGLIFRSSRTGRLRQRSRRVLREPRAKPRLAVSFSRSPGPSPGSTERSRGTARRR